MDARIVALFLFLCLSTGYTLKNDDIDDNILDMLQETNKLKEAPEMVSFDASNIMFSSCSCFAFLGILHPLGEDTQIKVICNFDCSES